MTPNKSLLGAAVIVPLIATFLIAYGMKQPSHHYPTRKHAGAIQNSSAPYAEAAQLEEWEL